MAQNTLATEYQAILLEQVGLPFPPGARFPHTILGFDVVVGEFGRR